MMTCLQIIEKHGEKNWRLLVLIALHGAHNLKVAGSNPAPATKYLADNTAKNKKASIPGSGLFAVLAHSWHTETQSPGTKSNKSQHRKRSAWFARMQFCSQICV
jgi:hypothetical protein